MGRRATLPATPAKLRDGRWGAWVRGRAAAGDELLITAKSGATWRAHVQEVLFRKKEGSLVILFQKTKRWEGKPVEREPLEPMPKQRYSLGPPQGKAIRARIEQEEREVANQ